MVNIDRIFQKIKEDKIKRIDDMILFHMFTQTANYNEIKFIMNKLKYLGVNISYKDYGFQLNFAEDYKSAKEIINNIIIYKKTHKLNKDINSMYYSQLMETTDTSEEAEEVFQYIKKDNIKPTIHMYRILMEKQESYINARNIFYKYILPTQLERINKWKEFDSNDGLKVIFGIMYIKARSNEELKEITKELIDLKMSTNINDYNYLNIKSSVRRANRMRNINFGESEEKVLNEKLNEFFNNDKKTFRSNVDIETKKINRSISSYERNANLVKSIKKIYNDTCQICEKRLDLGNQFYSEVHHIHPLYLNGPDIIENMIVLCPNHHVLFDRGAISIDLELGIVKYLNGVEEIFKMKNSNISKKYIDFHNQNIFNKKNKIQWKENIANDNIKFGSNVILINNETKEEIRIIIEKKEEDLTYLEFQLLGKKKGDIITIEEFFYSICEIN